jgi:FAD/FMN-containing dehydrogenase
MNDFGMRLVNTAKYVQGVRHQTRGAPYRQGHAAFAFLLDYVPDWKKAYGRGGLIQYQSFVPRDKARDVHPHLIELCHRSGLVPYLGVYKRHRPDPFLLTHAVDGFSFAMDFKVTATNRERLWELAHRLDEVVLAAGGRFYFAKDATMRPETAHRIWPGDVLAQFRALKDRCDPAGLLQTGLSRRLFPEFTSNARETAR